MLILDDETELEFPQEELDVLESSLRALFLTSDYIHDEGILILLEQLASRTKVQLFPDNELSKDKVNAASVSSLRSDMLFGLTSVMEVVKANMHRINLLWPIANELYVIILF